MKKNLPDANLFLETFLKEKEGKFKIKNLKKKNLIKDGILDSMDVIILASKIAEKFKIKINLSNETTLKKFEKFNSILSLIKKR
jgi:acyl carrier protein